MSIWKIYRKEICLLGMAVFGIVGVPMIGAAIAHAAGLDMSPYVGGI